MPISSKCRITGRGSVVVGTVESGKVRKGDKLEVRGFERVQKVQVGDIQVFNKSVPEASFIKSTPFKKTLTEVVISGRRR